MNIDVSSYTPPIAAVNREELKDWALREMRRLTDTLEKAGQCQHCVNFKDGHCQRWMVDVPAENQTSGCDDWAIDLVPF